MGKLPVGCGVAGRSPAPQHHPSIRPARVPAPSTPILARLHSPALAYPSAAASSALQRPSRLNMPALRNMAGVSGARVRFTPATAAAAAWRSARLFTAACMATREDEQAVSTLMAGPRMAKV